MEYYGVVEKLNLPLKHGSADVLSSLNEHLKGKRPENPVQVEDTKHLERFREHPLEYTEPMDNADCISTLRLITAAEIYAGNLSEQSLMPGQITAAEVARTVLIGMTQSKNLREIPMLNPSEDLLMPKGKRTSEQDGKPLKIERLHADPSQMLKVFRDMFLQENIWIQTTLGNYYNLNSALNRRKDQLCAQSLVRRKERKYK